MPDDPGGARGGPKPGHDGPDGPDASTERLSRLGERVRERVTRVIGRQWSALGWAPEWESGTSSEVAAVIDPESLVLASLGVVDHARSLVEVLSWWAEEGAGLMSVQRVRNLSADYPDRVRYRLGEFAGYAWKSGGDHRWKSLAGSTPSSPPAGDHGPPRLDGPGSVMLRLRLGLGVGIKADLLAFLLGSDGWRTVRAVADATGYTSRAVRRAGSELARGSWIEASPSSPTEYRASVDGWLSLLGLPGPAPWRHWHGQLSFVLAVDDWLRGDDWRDRSAAELEEPLRSLVEAHGPAFKWAGVRPPEPARAAEYVRAWESAVLDVVASMAAAV